MARDRRMAFYLILSPNLIRVRVVSAGRRQPGQCALCMALWYSTIRVQKSSVFGALGSSLAGVSLPRADPQNPLAK